MDLGARLIYEVLDLLSERLNVTSRPRLLFCWWTNHCTGGRSAAPLTLTFNGACVCVLYAVEVPWPQPIRCQEQ